MKIRIGFVSNSSASSFCIYGAYIKDLGEYLPWWNDEGYDEDESCDLKKERLNEEAKKLGLTVEVVDYDCNNPCYIGILWKRIQDDETGAQFKKRIEESLEKFLGKKVKCGTHEKAWHDG